MKINVIGLGYIGLPTAAVFAKYGAKVVGVDVDPEIISTINAGKIHIEEPGLSSLVKEVVDAKKLTASLTPEKADAFIIAVPTPSKEDEYKGCDLIHVKQACNAILPVLEKGNVVIVESTTSPRSTEDEIKPIFEAAGFEVGRDVYLSHCPERVLPGDILNEIINNDKIIGGITPTCADKAEEVYKIFVKGKIAKTNSNVSELSKLMENTFRDVNIALANELVKICNNLKINALDVIKFANMHPRVNILNPGAGVGGHCLAIDPYFVYEKDPATSQLIKLARDINNSMPLYVVEHAERLISYDKKKVITIFGMTYKPNVDDLRESPSLEIKSILIEKGYTVKVHDPHVNGEGYLSFERSLKDSNLLLVLVGHDEFKKIKYEEVKKLMKTVTVFDVANVLTSFNNSINYGNIFSVK